MFRLSLCSTTALLLVAYSSATATPITAVTALAMGARNGGHYGQGSLFAPCPGHACDLSFTAPAEGISRFTSRPSSTIDSPEVVWETPWADWRIESLVPRVTLDFARTATVHSVIVWKDPMPYPGDVDVPRETPIGGAQAAIPTGGNRRARAHLLPGLDPICNSVGVQFSRIAGTWAMADKGPVGGPSRSSIPRPAGGLLVPGLLIAVGLLGRKHVD